MAATSSLGCSDRFVSCRGRQERVLPRLAAEQRQLLGQRISGANDRDGVGCCRCIDQDFRAVLGWKTDYPHWGMAAQLRTFFIFPDARDALIANRPVSR